MANAVGQFDGNLLTTFKVMVKKLLTYFLWTRCIGLNIATGRINQNLT